MKLTKNLMEVCVLFSRSIIGAQKNHDITPISSLKMQAAIVMLMQEAALCEKSVILSGGRKKLTAIQGTKGVPLILLAEYVVNLLVEAHTHTSPTPMYTP